MVEYSVIIPVYNEQDCIEELYRSLYSVMESIGGSFEIIFVNDGSDDRSSGILKKISSIDDTLVIVNLNSHSGKSLALQTGFAYSKGQTIITIDADLQYDAKDIPQFLSRKNEGFDVVCGWRRNRRDPWLKIIASKIANYIRGWVFEETIHDVGCSFRVYTREAFESLNLYRERQRFITAILTKKGFHLGEIKVKHYPRRFGVSKYGIINRFFRSIPDFFSILIKG